MRSLKPDITTSQDLSIGAGTALDYTYTVLKAFKLSAIHFHASEAITETITITLDSYQGANYDTKLKTIYLVSSQDAVFRPEGDCDLQAGDKIRLQCTAANDTGIIYANIKRKELGA